MITKTTKQAKGLFILFMAMSILCNVAPLAAYTIAAYCAGALVAEKVMLTTTVFIVLIMTAVAFINKTAMKSRIWILLLGLYMCLDNFITPLLIIGICQIVDEWIATPLQRHFRNKYTINKEMDKRGA